MKNPRASATVEDIPAIHPSSTLLDAAWQANDGILATLVQASPIGIAISTLDGARILSVNERFLTLTGYTQQELVGQSALALGLWIDPERREDVVTLLRARQPVREFHTQLRTKDGETRHVVVSSEAIDVGGLECALSQVFDITALRAAEAALNVAQARYRALVEQIPAITYTERLGDSGIFAYVSPQIEAILGYAPEEVIDRPGLTRAMIHPDDRERVQAEGERTSATGEPFCAEYRVKTRDGRWLHVHDQAVLIRDDAGTPLHWQGVLFDVSEQRQTELALRESERKSRVIVEAALDSVITMDQEGYVTDFNPAAEQTFGYARDEAVGRLLAELIAPPQWRDALKQRLDRAVTDGSEPDTGKRVETVARRADGALIPIEFALARVSGDADGSFVAYLRDISSRVEMEAALLTREERFRALVQSSYDVITVLNADGTRQYVSPSIEPVLGYAPSELMAGSAWDLVHPEDAPLLQRAVDLCLHGAKQTPVFSLRFRHRNGDWRHFEAVATNLLHEPAVQGIVFNSRDVTERKRTEVALRESEARFRAVWEATSEALALSDPNGIVLAVNPAYSALYGLDPEAVIGRSFSIIFPENERSSAEAQYRAIFADPDPRLTYEARVQRADGTERVVEAGADFILDAGQRVAMVSVIRDVTARHTAETALRESEERFRNAFDHAPIGLALVSRDGRFTRVNRSLCEIVGYSEQELLDMTFQDITHPDDLDDDLGQVARLWAGELDTYRLEKRFLHEDGRAVWVELTASAVRDEDGTVYGIAHIEDITNRRRLDIERATLLASEREYTRQLRDLAEMRADLTSMVAHELRSPVAAMRMLTSMLSTRELSPHDETTTLAAVNSELATLDRLVNDVAAVAAAEREDFSVQFARVSLNVLLADAAAFARAAFEDHPFAFDAAPDIRVWCDPERISQVLRNLLENSARHTPRGTPVELRARLEGPRVRIEVADYGPGLAPNDLAVIFEKFGRGHDAVAQSTPGAGLGLYVSQQIVRAHGQELMVQSASGSGTTFSFSLQVAT